MVQPFMRDHGYFIPLDEEIARLKICHMRRSLFEALTVKMPIAQTSIR